MNIPLFGVIKKVSESTPPGDGDRLIRRHRQMLAIACAIGVLAFVLQERPDGRVSFRGLTQIPLPQTCFSRSWLGLKCPGLRPDAIDHPPGGGETGRRRGGITGSAVSWRS